MPGRSHDTALRWEQDKHWAQWTDRTPEACWALGHLDEGLYKASIHYEGFRVETRRA